MNLVLNLKKMFLIGPFFLFALIMNVAMADSRFVMKVNDIFHIYGATLTTAYTGRVAQKLCVGNFVAIFNSKHQFINIGKVKKLETFRSTPTCVKAGDNIGLYLKLYNKENEIQKLMTIKKL